MAEFYFSANTENGGVLCLAPLTDRCIAMSGQTLSDTSGYFLFEKRGSDDFPDIEIIAHVLSEEAALKLRDMFNMS